MKYVDSQSRVSPVTSILMTKFRIHCGAHKTATTHLQDSLLLASEQLRDSQTVYIPRAVFRKKGILAQVGLASNRMSFWRFKRPSLERILSENGYSADTIIISDENILGSTRCLLAGIYPDAKHKLTKWKRVIGRDKVDIFISIRNYKDILPSAYSQALRDGEMRSFESILNNWIDTHPSWLSLINTARDLFSNSQVTIWSFDNYIKDALNILSEFSGVALTELDLRGSDQNRRMPAEAISKIQKLERSLSRSERSERILDVLKGSSPDPYDPVTIENKEILNSRYLQDCEAIKNMNVRVIGL